MKKLSVLLLLAIFSTLLIVACTKEKKVGETQLSVLEPQLPSEPYEYTSFVQPAHIPPTRLPIENNKATLGRVLFYDKMLSINNTIACASCHIQLYAFSDGQKVSMGVTPVKTKRNSLAIMNPDRENGFFWDLRESSLQTMVLKPIQNHIEMGFDKMDNVVANIQQTPYYNDLFVKAFGSSDVTEAKIGEALANFLASMRSHQSKYDIGKQSNFANFNNMELLGKELFTEKLYCKNCHVEPDFTTSWGGVANIGLDLDYDDEGTGDLPDNNDDRNFIGPNGGFKIPSLRNIELTAPYMHDGRFKTLEEVIEHYNSGVQNHPELDWNLKAIIDKSTGQVTGLSDQPIRLELSTIDKAALVAFLKTLTDHSYVNDVRFSDPFKVKE